MTIENNEFQERKLPENNNTPNESEQLIQEIRDELACFIGSVEFYKVYPNFIITEGVKFLTDRTEAYWLIHLVYSYQGLLKVKDEPFQLYELKVDTKKETAVITCSDGNGNILKTQDIHYTSFPLDYIKLYFADGTLLLPSEY